MLKLGVEGNEIVALRSSIETTVRAITINADDNAAVVIAVNGRIRLLNSLTIGALDFHVSYLKV